MANIRNTIAYFKEESVVNTAEVPASAIDGYLSIEKPDITTGQRETLTSDLQTGNIGNKKPQLGPESATASCVTELRSHGDVSSPTQPDFGMWLESAIGTPNISTADAVQAAPAPSTTEFGIATEGNIKKHDMIIVDNATDGRVPRFVASMKIDIVLGVNDKIDVNEDAGGESILTLSAGTYIHGSSDVAGSIGEEIKTRLDVGTGTYTVTALANSDGSYSYTISASGLTSLSLLNATGTSTATNFLNLNMGFGALDLTGVLTYTAATDVYGNRVVCNVAMTSAPTSADVVSATVNYKPIDEAHKHFTSGFYVANSTSDGYLEQVIGSLVSSLGFSIETGAIAKISAEIQGLSSGRTATTASPYAPSYEDVQGFVGFNVLAFLDSTQICANAFELTVDNEVGEKQTFCTANGKTDSILRSRAISGTLNPYADGTVDYYDAINENTDYALSIFIGVKDAGGFTLGKTVGIYLPQISFSGAKTNDIDDNVINDLAFSANTGNSGNLKEIVVSFG